MKQNKNNKNFKLGFTLLELLVVVLIIGILAGIALPQYKKAVTKSKAAQLQTAVASVTRAMENFYLAQGSYPKSLDELDVEINLPTVNGLDARKDVTCGHSLISYSYKRGDDFEIALYSGGIGRNYRISAHFIKGKYKCRGFMHYLSNNGSLDGNTYCGEHYYNRSCGSAGCDTGIFCNDVMGMKKRVYGGSLMCLFK